MTSQNEHWEALHTTLKEALQKEVHLMRELLSNLHQEELSLMFHDDGSLNHILQQRSQIVDRLSTLRLHRIKTTEEIEKMVSSSPQAPSVDQLLPPHEDSSSEILSLRDQLMSLTERMNKQNSLNVHLAEHPERFIPPRLQAEEKAREKRKASIATYQIKK
jgi:hypothetical protein